MYRIKKKIFLIFGALVVLIILLILILEYSNSLKDWEDLYNQFSDGTPEFAISEIHITVVACGERLEETLTMIKSALIYNKRSTYLNFKIIAEDILKENFKSKLLYWQKIMADKFSFQIYSLRFPKLNKKLWRKLFKPCAAQRLFLPSLLDNLDATIYVDTDVIFLSSAAKIWSHFNYFNASHIAGLSSEHEDESIGWYNRFARHPFFGKLGVNSGVMLMNLTRMRNFDWENQIIPLYNQYKSQITWGDQDIINILFYYHPDKLFIFSCIYNYRPDHCMYVNCCDIATDIQILHGNRGYFHTNKQPIFKKIYDVCNNFEVGNINEKRFNYKLSQTLQTMFKNSTCAKIGDRINLVSHKNKY